MVGGKDLIGWGWPSGPELGKALEKARLLEMEGLSLAAIRSQLEPLREALTIKMELREPDSERLKIALDADGPAEEANLVAVRRQMEGMVRIPVVEKAALLPDACPVGNEKTAITVGGAIAVRGAIIPSAHSADICCSMYCSLFEEVGKGTKEMMDVLQRSTRFGIGGRQPETQIHHPVLEEKVWRNPFLAGLEKLALVHLGDQGDGNHFAFLGRIAFSASQIELLAGAGYGSLGSDIEAGKPYLALVTHHGSRGLGAQVYKRGQKAAAAHTKRVAKEVPKSGFWLDAETEEGRAYWDALQYVARWTRANHQVIHRNFLSNLGKVRALAEFGNEHNFVWRREDGLYYHGKGATPAWEDKQGRPLLGLIPLNMGAPILVVLGRSNEAYLGFAPHGAGRNLSRSALVRTIASEGEKPDGRTIEQVIAASTTGLDVRWWSGKADLSETPLAYKPPTAIIAQIEKYGLATICGMIEPLGSIMAGDFGPAPWKRAKDQLSAKDYRQMDHRRERRSSKQHLPDDPDCEE
ncbi:MAG: RtcB family protein [Puniceicoccaceae bacterium]